MKLNRLRLSKVTRLLAVSVAGASMVLVGVLPAQAAPTGTTCAGGTLAGTYGNLLVTGECTVVAPLTVNGQLTITGKGAVFFSEYPGSPSVTINGNVFVKHGGMLALGNPDPEGCGNAVRATSVVKGNVVASGALSVKILCSTVKGNVISTGGGYSAQPQCLTQGGTNFPLKDNKVSGSIIVTGWSGCWMGVIRNQVSGNVILTRNTSAAFEPGTTNPDGMEIVTNDISGNLICHGNAPHPQVGDSGGEANQVAGNKLGQCASIQ